MSSSRFEYPFEKLRVWQDMRALCRSVYGVTRFFPESEKYGLTSQCNRAAVSVAANIAEGSARTTAKDQAHFSQLAYGSLTELACLLLLALDFGFITEQQEKEIRDQIESVSRQLDALRKTQLARVAN